MVLKVPNTLLQNVYRNSCLTRRIVLRTSSSRVPESVLIEKCVEEPVLVISENDDVDIIGPPDSVSNLRPIIRTKLINETVLQQKLREMQDATQSWNQQFWATHNTNFIKERQEFIEKHQVVGEERRQLGPDEMSQFYKSFLDKNWENHLKYNFKWYKKNFTLLFLAFCVSLEKNLTKLR